MEIGDISLREQHRRASLLNKQSIPRLQGDLFIKDDEENKILSSVSGTDSEEEATSITEDGETPGEATMEDMEDPSSSSLSSPSPFKGPPLASKMVVESQGHDGDELKRGDSPSGNLPETTIQEQTRQVGSTEDPKSHGNSFKGLMQGLPSIEEEFATHISQPDLEPIASSPTNIEPPVTTSSTHMTDDNILNESKEKTHVHTSKNQPSELGDRLEDGATATATPPSDVLHSAPFLTHIARGIGTFFLVFGVCCLIGSLALTYPFVLPMVEKIMFANLTITNTTEGFSFDTIEDAPNVTWYFWNITNHNDFIAGISPPTLEQLGPYVLHQKIRIFETNFSDDGNEVYRSSATFGEYIATESCAICSLNDKITMVNNVYLYFTGLYASESQLLQQYIPNVIRNDLSKIADYLKAHGYASSTAQAKDMALQQWADCSILSYASIRQMDSSWLYYPEICGWALYVEGIAANITKTDASNILYNSAYALLNYKFGDAFAIENLFILVYPKGLQNAPQKLPTLKIGQTLVLINYVNYLNLYGTRVYFEEVFFQNMGLFMTRTVQEIIFGYYDPILEGYYGNKTQLAFVGAVNSMDLITQNPEYFIEFGGYTGFRTGKENAKEMFTIIQQGTSMGLKAKAVNTQTIDWEHGSIAIYGSIGSFFGPSVVQKDKPQIIWMDLLNRHVVLDYNGAYTLNGLDIYRYHLSDFSLQACDELPLGAIEEEGPCIYPQYFQGVFNLTRFTNLFYLTLPHFLRADRELKYTLGPAGQNMSSDPSWDMTIDVEPFWGASINVSIMFQSVVRLKRTDILRPNLWLNTSSSMFPDTIWLPVNIIATQITPNGTLLHSLWVGKYFIYAVIFFLVHFIPFFAIVCVLCGIHLLWKKRCFFQTKSKKTEALQEEILVATVIDPIELQIEQHTLARVVPSFEEMLAQLEKLRTTKESPTSIPIIEEKVSLPPISPSRQRKLSILVEEETSKVERPKSPRGSKAPEAMFVEHVRLSTHASFFIHNHERQSLLEMRKSRHARSFKLSIQEAFVEGPDPIEQKVVVTSTGLLDVVPSIKEPETIQAPFFEPSKKEINDEEQKTSTIGPALLGDISPRE